MLFNPFLVFVVALIVLVAIVRISYHRNGTQAATGPNASATTGPNVVSTLAVVLAVCLVPFGIAIAALSGPSFGFATYFVLLAVGATALSATRRRRS
jgi:protein-S-isoprenylcysteine O-methyltransferase Ste14